MVVLSAIVVLRVSAGSGRRFSVEVCCPDQTAIDLTVYWSARVDAADAFVFVTPEYNHGMTAALKNAIDYLNQEWQYKPLGFVSYGGVAGGTRSVQAIKPIANVLKMTPIPEAVVIPLFQRFMTDDGTFKPEELIQDAAITMLGQLGRWATTLRPMRDGVSQPA
jgi:NAD(P)H-dependent FMN reductase